jgi:hypothetical protein
MPAPTQNIQNLGSLPNCPCGFVYLGTKVELMYMNGAAVSMDATMSVQSCEEALCRLRILEDWEALVKGMNPEGALYQRWY